MTKRQVTPHKGGRTLDTHVRMTPETKELLKALNTSAADLLEEAVQAKAKELNIMTRQQTEIVASLDPQNRTYPQWGVITESHGSNAWVQGDVFEITSAADLTEHATSIDTRHESLHVFPTIQEANAYADSI